jgi:hypothetical protein
MAKKKEKCIDSSMDEAQLILSKHRDLGYVPFLSAGHQMQKDARAQFAGVREDYQHSHPVGLVMTYATLSNYYPDAKDAKVMQVWKQAAEDWQTLGDRTRNVYSPHEYKKWALLHGRDETTFDKEKNRKSLLESYIHWEREQQRQRRTANKSADDFDGITFQEAATNDILLNSMFLANSSSNVDNNNKREQFQREKNVKYIDASVEKVQRLQNEAKQRLQNTTGMDTDAMELYIEELEANGVERKRRKNPAESDPKKALAHTSAMMITRGLQGAAKNAVRGIVKPF